MPREPGKASEAEGDSATESEKKEEGPWDETDVLRGHLVALQSGFMSDLTVIVEEEKFRCHTYILGVASPKLAGMLKPNQHELQLSGVTSINFRILLEIMYSGAAKELQTDLAKTLHIRRDANLLQVYKAAAYCTQLLRKQLDAQNVCSVLDEPGLMNDIDLEACVKVSFDLFVGKMQLTTIL
ncbi:hypothetical protein B566_EDAN015312 [Ephemera danica]|nr:hypothetical protein B566_EDAN015312 [Ephemera danica]